MVRSALQLSLISPSILTWKTIRHDPLIELFATCNKSGGRSMIGNTNLITFFYVKQLSIHFPHFYDELNLHIKSIYFLFSKRFIFMTYRNTYIVCYYWAQEKDLVSDCFSIFVLTCTIMGCVWTFHFIKLYALVWTRAHCQWGRFTWLQP